MAGREFLQIPGPTNVPHRVQQAMDRPLINHRGEDMPELMFAVLAGLKRLFGTDRGEVLLTAGAGSGAMESSLVNTVDPGGRVLALAAGNFGEWYARQAGRLGADVEVMSADWGASVRAEQVEARLRADSDHSIRVVTMVHNETSTGVTADVLSIRRAIDAAGHPALLLVDVVSSLGCMEVRFDEWGVDVAACGAQKGLMLPPGMAIVCVSPRAIEACRQVTTARSFYDWRPHLEMLPQGISPTTPPTSLLFGLRESLAMLQEEGLDQVYARHARLANGVRGAVQAWDLGTVCRDPALASNSVTAVSLPAGLDATEVVRYAKHNLQLELGAGIGPLHGRSFRIGHMGWLNELEVLATVGGTELALGACGFGLELGAGVSAALRLFAGAARADQR